MSLFPVMRFVLLLQVCLLGLGLSRANPGREFLMMFPQNNDPTANFSREITVTATGFWTSVTVEVLESAFRRHFFLYDVQSKNVHLPSSVGMTSDRSSNLLRVKSTLPISVVASFCTQAGCDHSLLHGVPFWGTHYYPIAPLFPDQTVVSQVVITSSDQETSVDVVLSGEVVFEGNLYPRSSVLELHIGALGSVQLQSNASLSGSEIHSQQAVCVVVGFTCSKSTPTNCSYGFAELEPVSQWGFDYAIPALVNTGMSSSFLLAMTTINSELEITVGTERKNVSVISSVMEVIPVMSSDEIHIASDNPLQLLYFRHGTGNSSSSFVVMRSVDDVCQTPPKFDSVDMIEQLHGSGRDGKRWHSDIKFSGPNSAQLPEETTPRSQAELDIGLFLSTINGKAYPALCKKNATSCEDVHCRHKRECGMNDGKPFCSLKTKICSAWGDSYFRTFDGRRFELQGNCNYTLVQTTCPGLNVSVPVQINIARDFSKGATIAAIHTVQVWVQGFNISMVKEEKHQIRVDGQRRNLPLTLGNGSLNVYPSGSGVVLDTTFGLILQYDWHQNLQVEVGPELYGSLCGLCGNANHNTTDDFVAPNDTEQPQAVDFFVHWRLNSGTGSCTEDCGGRVSCPACTTSQIATFTDVSKHSFVGIGCSLLQMDNGPFAKCNAYIDPEPYVHSCMTDLCIRNGAASAICRTMTAYASICQRLGIRVAYWRGIAKCTMVCPTNSHYETCGSACPATCGNPEAQYGCSLPCVESCQCNMGYMLSGGKCVPYSQCGCTHRDAYYLPEETVWMGQQCQKRCVCQATSRKVTCAQSHCQAGEVCKVINGVLGCHVDNSGVCIAKWDHHYTTFDGRNFDFHGNCTYLLAGHCPSWGDLDNFRVELRNQMKENTRVAFSRLIKMFVHGYSIEISRDWSYTVMVNGLLLSLPSVLSHGKVKIYMIGLSMRIETDFGVIVTYNSDLLTVQVPGVFSGALCGLCGDFNTDPEDDLKTEEESDISMFVRRWRTSSGHGCVDAVPWDTSQCRPRDEALYIGDDYCGRLLDTEGAFQNCHKAVDPHIFFENCVHDLCYGKVNQTMLCQILSIYVAVCQEAGVIMGEWRTSDFCNLSCPSNSEYHLCSNPVSGSCVDPPGPKSLTCKEGCFCKPGFFRSGGKCVPNAECGCFYNGVYHQIYEKFYPDEHCQVHCTCVGHGQVHCTNYTCPNGTKCTIKDGHQTCYPSENTVKCTVMGGRHFQNYDGHNFDFNMGDCHYVLSQVCDTEQSDLIVIIQQGQLHLRVYGVNVTLEVGRWGKVKVEGASSSLPLQLEHTAIVQSGSLTRVVMDTGVVVTYGGPDLIQIVIPNSYGRMCGLCGNLNGSATANTQNPSGNQTSDSIFAYSWVTPPSGTNCSEGCGAFCSACNSTMGAEFASDNFCGVLSAHAGSFSGCHSTVDPQPFFKNCVNDLCASNGGSALYCNSLRGYTFACQEAGAEVQPWRAEKCSLSCPANSRYNVCVSACPASCATLPTAPCPSSCVEGCRCDSGYVQSAKGCVRAEDCGCFYRGRYYELRETFWTEGCAERCNCSAPDTLLCEPTPCPEGASCTHNDTRGCAGKAEEHKLCETGKPCGARSRPQRAQCWVLGGSHFYTFDGAMFEFQGNCTYTLVRMHANSSAKDSLWVGLQKDRTENQASALKAIHVKVAKDHVAVYRGEKGYAWINGQKRLLPASLQFGQVKVHQSGIFSVVDTNLGVQVKYDGFHYATVLLSDDADVHGLCGNNNGIEEDDLSTPEGSVNSTAFGWSWRVPDEDGDCTADCGGTCPSCPADQLKKNNVTSYWISLHEYLWSRQNPFYLCQEVVHYTFVYSVVSLFDLCVSGDSRKVLCRALEAYAAACQNAQVHIGEWRNSTSCPMSCPVNSHYESCGSACPATCQGPSSLAPCALACVETCQCDPGFILEGDACVPSSRCGCVHNGYRYHGNQTFWADEGCTEQCVCDPRTHQTRCQLASCGPDEYCGLHDGVTACVPHPWQTCVYSGRHFTTFDQRDYDLQGTCQYQLLSVCRPRRGLAPVEVHVQSDGHLESALHVLVIVDGTLVEMNSKNIERIEVNGVTRRMPYLLNPTAVAFSVGLHTYIYTDFGFVFSLGARGGVDVRLSGKYANATCGLCGNFNSDPADDLTASGSQERLNPEQFGKAWRSGRNPWCVEGCLGGSCPTCVSEQLARYSDPGACGRILEANGPFRDCHGKVDPSSFYKRCVDDLCLHGGLQHALCNSLAEYTAACLFHQARVHTWRSSGFCHHSCPSDTSYSMSAAPVHFCLGWLNRTVEMPPNAGENCLCEAGSFHSGALCVPLESCGCSHHGEYLGAGQELSTCERSCVCHAGGRVVCRDVSCGQGEECALRGGVRGCRPRPKEARCSADGGSQYTTFDGQTFELYGSCNYTLAQTCSLKETDAAPFTIAVQGGQKAGMQIYLQANKMYFKISDNYPDQVQVNGVLENLPFSQNNVTVLQENGRLTIQVLGSVQLSSDLYNHILVKVPDVYQRTTCGLCGNYNGDRSDDLRLPDGTAASDPSAFGSSWRSSHTGSSCGDATYRLCRAPVPAHTSDLRCGLLTHPTGPFSTCHRLVHPQRYHSLCMAHLCVTRGQSRALCDSLQAYELACREEGVDIGVWRNTTGCAYQCPQFSHYSQCANACSSLCPGVGRATRCPGVCEEGCRCDGGHLYDGHACVPAGRCGCLHNGRRFKASESRLLQNCSVKCACGPPLVCEEHSCPAQHSCVVTDGVMGCSSAVANSPDPCEGRCEKLKECLLSNGVPVCKPPGGFCWARGGQHYRPFDGPGRGLEGARAYLLAASRGAALGPTPFSVSVKSDCCGSATASSTHVLTVQAYGFVVQLNREKGSVWVNGVVEYLPVRLSRDKIQVADGGGEVRLNTDFGLQVVFDWASTVAVTLDPHYMGEVYGLCGNFNGDSLDEHTAQYGTPPSNSAYVAQARRLYNGDNDCLTKQSLDNPAPTVAPEIISSYRRLCAVLEDQQGRFARCHSKVDPGSFYQSCVAELARNGGSKVSLDQAMNSYSMVCGQVNDGYDSGTMIDASCPPNSHYKTCGSSCPPSCESILAYCNKKCVRGCFCDPGFLKSPEGCVRPEQCGCRDSTGKYHSVNTTFWTPENCGQTCVCDPAAGAVDCEPAQCHRGQVCKQLGHKSFCQPKDPVNCTLVAGLYFTTFDGHHFEFRDGCAYSLVGSSSNHTELTAFNITISDASCQNRLFHSLNLKLSVYGVEMVVNKDDPERFLVDGLHKALPYSHQTGRVQAYRTPSSLVFHVDFGLQLILYKTGAITVILPGAYASAVSGLCGNANGDPRDDDLMPDGERAQNALEFAHSWRSGGADACRSRCPPPPRASRCPPEARRLFEGRDFCGVLRNELGPFEECAAALSPERHFRGCVADTCSYGGHASALCNAVASYAAACQAVQLPVRQWRSDTFCGMTCPKNSHYELCGPRCPAACAGPSSPTNCSGGCQEGCQCDPGYVLSDGRCVPASDCGCVRDGQYYPAGYFYPGNSCQKCDCRRGEVTCDPAPCRPQESCSLEGGLARCRPLQYGVCQVLAGFGYITFDGLALTHHGACTYIVSELSSKTLHDYTLLLGFKKERNGTVHKISRVVFRWSSLELSIDPETPWKIQLNREELSLPFDMGKIRAYQDGHSLTIATMVGVKIQLSSTQYLRLSVPQGYDTTASGLCGNFNGDQSDDLQLQSNRLTNSTAEFLHSWAVVAPGRRCDGNCGTACDECSVSLEAATACDVLLVRSGTFVHRWNSGADAHVYRDACVGAVCAGAGPEEAACLALEAYAAACRAHGRTVGPWREDAACPLPCPDRSGPGECVDSGSNSCPALLRPGSAAAGCSEGCRCLKGHVFDGDECVPHSRCGCVIHERYVKMDQQLYTKDCTQRCWCHPLGGALCETAACDPGQQCALKNGSWGCHEQPGVCGLWGGLKAITLSGQQLSLEPRVSYSLLSLCDETSDQWFSLVSYNGPCGGDSSRVVTVVQVLLHGLSVAIWDGKVKVNGSSVSLPYMLPSGVSLSSSVTLDESEVTVVLKKDAGLESELEMEIGVTMVTVKLPLWYTGKLCGLCEDRDALRPSESVKSWVLPEFPGCGFRG